jgi:hypothetical protein
MWIGTTGEEEGRGLWSSCVSFGLISVARALEGGGGRREPVEAANFKDNGLYQTKRM